MGSPHWYFPAAPVSAGRGGKSQAHRAMRLPKLGHLLQLDSSCRFCLPASVSLRRKGESQAWKGRRVFPLDAYYWQGSWLTLLCHLCQASLVLLERFPLDMREKWTYLLLPSVARLKIRQHQVWMVFCWVGGCKTSCFYIVPPVLGFKLVYLLPPFRILLWLYSPLVVSCIISRFYNCA